MIMRNLHVKYSFLLLFVLCISLFRSPVAFAEGNDPTVKLSLAGNESVASLCADGKGGFYLLTSECIYHWNDEKTPAGELAILTDNVQGLAGIAVDKDDLYAVSQQHEVFLWASGGWKSIGESPLHAKEDSFFRCCVSIGNGMLFYSYKDQNDQIHLYSFDITSGVFQQLTAFPSAWFCYEQNSDTLLSLAQDTESGSWNILRYDYRKGQSDDPILIGDIPDNIIGQAYDQETGALYLGTRDAIMIYSQGRNIEKFANSRSAGIIAALGNGRAAIASNQTVRVYSREESSSSQITVLGFKTMITGAAKWVFVRGSY